MSYTAKELRNHVINHLSSPHRVTISKIGEDKIITGLLHKIDAKDNCIYLNQHCSLVINQREVVTIRYYLQHYDILDVIIIPLPYIVCNNYDSSYDFVKSVSTEHVGDEIS